MVGDPEGILKPRDTFDKMTEQKEGAYFLVTMWSPLVYLFSILVYLFSDFMLCEKNKKTKNKPKLSKLQLLQVSISSW